MAISERRGKDETTREIMDLAQSYFPDLVVNEDDDTNWVRVHVSKQNRFFGLLGGYDVVVFRYEWERSNRVYIDVYKPDYLKDARTFAHEFVSRNIDPYIKDFSTIRYF